MTSMTVKEKILHVALDFFSQKGYNATTLDEIAEAAGMKAPNIYNYFKDKEDILRNIPLIADEPYQGLIGYDQKMPIWIHNGDELKQFTKYHVNHTMTNETIVKLRRLCTIEQFKYDGITEKTSKHQYDLINALYERLFNEMIDKGSMKPGDPKVRALQYSAPITLLIQLYDRAPDRSDEVEKMLEDHLNTFIEAYCVNE